MTKTYRTAILGASGYTGADMVRLCLGHPHIKLVALSGERKAGVTAADVLPNLRFTPALPDLVAAETIDWTKIDLVFGCLPHATSQAIIAHIFTQNPHIRVVDLSADFRLRDSEVYRNWYGVPHVQPALLTEAVYGLSEYARAVLPMTRLVACPGCYPTATLLALLPLLEQRLIAPSPITINALSGVSGAGRSLKEQNLFCEVAEAVHPYAIGAHRHMPEIEQELSRAAGQKLTISFTPHLIPINRGELETIIVNFAAGVTVGQLRQALAERYASEAFVHLLPEGVAPATRQVRGSNHVVLNVFPDRIEGRAILVVAIDNLVKGSGGQALQNANIMLGLDESMGLAALPLFP